MNDMIANYLTRIRNAMLADKSSVVGIPSSRVIEGISRVLKEEGYIEDFRVTEIGSKRTVAVDIRYHNGRPVISRIVRRRVYMPVSDLPHVRAGLGISILSTSRGIMSDRKARELNVGGEVLCQVW